MRVFKVMPTLLATVIFTCLTADAVSQPQPIRLAIAKTFLSEQPKGIAEIATDDFKIVLKKATGLAGEISSKYTPLEIAAKLDNKQLDLGIFHAHEFAWMHKKYPQLVPLLIAADKYHVEYAYVIVHKNSPAKTLADLRGKKFDVPVGTKEHCRVFLHQACGEIDKKEPAAFFGAIEKSSSKKAALDNVANQSVAGTVIDLNGLEFYKEIRGPVFAKNLRILQESASFPPAVVAYKPGTLDQKTLDKFRDGLIKAHTIPEGRDMMKSWNIESFAPIPKTYQKELADVLKAYPPPLMQ